ncbi:YbfB/YjiJ family MFS transporter [Priestia endophytica]|uniref:YbfB/YjiJ family MFS transporter n=1 Tax=Priestia endophytica TaxID=135735 RepID=UPI000DCA7D0C|nr:YbfB/YjiJ family MFS transporter [Priestia endophytica]RAS71551.1 MFS transporter [Priestia endophytica]
MIKVLIGGILSLVTAMGVARFSYTPILPLMQNDMLFSNGVAGYLATSNYAGYLVGAVLAGIFPLKQRRKAFLRLSLILSVITTAGMGLIQSYLIWYVFRFVSGFSSAFVLVLASSIVLDKLAEKGKTNWSGIFYGGVGIGIFITGLIIPILNRYFEWEGAWIGLSVASLIFTFLVWIWLKDTASNPTQNTKKEIPTHGPPIKWLPWLITAYGLEGLGYIVTGTFIVSIAEETPNFNGDATFIWMIVGLAAIPSCIIWSSLAKKWGFVKSLIFAMILQSFGIVIPVLLMTKTGLLVSALLFGATFMGITTLATTLASRINPRNSSRIIGYLTAIYAAGQMIGPMIAGSLASASHNYNSALIGAAIVVLIGAIFLLTGIQFDNKPVKVVIVESSNENMQNKKN